MYYPYLRGRQFELIALREFAQDHKDNTSIIPIIEPVKKTFNSIKIALKIFDENNQKFAIILNPQVGEIENNNQIVDELSEKLTNNSKWIPAFIVTSNYNEIISIIDEYDEVMLVCSDIVDCGDVGDPLICL